MTIVPVAEFAPDQPELANTTNLALNVIPRTENSYGPFSGLSSYSANALNSQCLGTFSCQDTDLTVHMFAGTATKLYQMDDASSSWLDISGTSYSMAPGDNWRMTQFNRTVIATNFGGPIQQYTFGTSTVFTDLSADAPFARHICTPKQFVFVGNTYDNVGGFAPGRVWWSANGDPTNWPTPGSALAQQTMSDYNDFPGPAGEITSLASSLNGCDVVIFFRHSVWRGFFVGPPDVFDFYPAENVRGCPAPNSTVTLGGTVYYLGEDGFYAYDGQQSIPIGANKVDKWFWAQVNQGSLSNIIGAADVINKAVMWVYPSRDSTSGMPDRMIIYRWDIGRWSLADLDTEWISRFMTFGVSMDAMPSIGFTDTDTLPASLDSRIWIGGALTLGAINTDHKLAYFNGSNLEAQVGSNTMQIFPNGRAFVTTARPIIDGAGTYTTVSMETRETLYDAPVIGPAIPPNIAGECPQRSDARYHSAIITVPAGQTWNHISGVDLQAIPAGTRGRQSVSPQITGQPGYILTRPAYTPVTTDTGTGVTSDTGVGVFST